MSQNNWKKLVLVLVLVVANSLANAMLAKSIQPPWGDKIKIVKVYEVFKIRRYPDMEFYGQKHEDLSTKG
jgi:hypothetical protein